MRNSWAAYEGEAGAQLAAAYETVSAKEVHSWLVDSSSEWPSSDPRCRRGILAATPLGWHPSDTM